MRVSVVLLIVFAPGCGGSDSKTEAPLAGELVRFRAADGVRLEGRTFGGGSTTVVLSHMGRGGDSQVDWYPVARALASEGYLALTYNRRGVCWETAEGCSRGTDDLAQSWKDVVGAYRYVRERGAAHVILVGASIGAMSSLHAASRTHLDIDGLVEIGGINDASGYSFERKDLADVAGAKLFVSSEEDIYGGAAAAREWYRWARGPKELVILKGSDHGTDMLRPNKPTRGRLIRLILEFVKSHGSSAQ